MFKNAMLAILIGLFDRIKTYVDGKFAPKSTVYTKTETDTTFYKKSDAIDAATLGQKSLSQIETEQAAARTTLQNTIMTALANNVERIGNHVITTNNTTVQLSSLIQSVFGGSLEDGYYQIVFTSDAFDKVKTVQNGGVNYEVSNGDYIMFAVAGGEISDVTHRNDLTNEALSNIVTTLNTKASKSHLQMRTHVIDVSSGLEEMIDDLVPAMLGDNIVFFTGGSLEDEIQTGYGDYSDTFKAGDILYFHVSEDSEGGWVFGGWKKGGNTNLVLNQLNSYVSSTQLEQTLADYYNVDQVDNLINNIAGSKVIIERTMFWNGTTNYSLSELKDFIASDPFFSFKKGYYVLNVSAHWSLQDANFANSGNVMTVSLGNGTTSLKYGDKIELYFDGVSTWSLEAVHASVHTTWINKLKEDTDFQLAQLQTDLFAHVDAATAA